MALLLRHALRTFSAFSSSSLRLRFIFRSLASLITHSHLLLEYQLSPWNAIKSRLSLIISRTAWQESYSVGCEGIIGKDICPPIALSSKVKPGLISKILILALLLLLATPSPVWAYGKSVEDLIGVFSINKEIKIGSSSQCFSSEEASDPLKPPGIGLQGSLSDDQAPGIAGLFIEPQQISLSSPQPVNLTAHLIDDQAIWAAEAAFFGPGGKSITALFSSQNRSSGTARDGFYDAQILLPGNISGEWHLKNLTLVDREGNRKTLSGAELKSMGLPTDIAVA